MDKDDLATILRAEFVDMNVSILNMPRHKVSSVSIS